MLELGIKMRKMWDYDEPVLCYNDDKYHGNLYLLLAILYKICIIISNFEFYIDKSCKSGIIFGIAKW